MQISDKIVAVYALICPTTAGVYDSYLLLGMKSTDVRLWRQTSIPALYSKV